MINQPESNIKFTDEETKRINEYKSRLANLDSEVIIYSQNIAVLRDDLTKAKKEQSSLWKDVEGLKELKALLLRDVEKIKLDISAGEEKLEIHQKEHSQMNAEAAVTQEYLQKREKELIEKEKKNESDRSLINDKLIQIAKDSAVLEKKHNILSEAIKAIGNRAA